MSETTLEAGGNPGYLNCSKPDCLRENPQPVSSFFKNSKTARGYHYTCKECLARKATERHLESKTKTCSNVNCPCQNPQPSTEFVRTKNRCRTCRSIHYRSWEEANKEHRVDYRKEYYFKNVEAIAERRKSYYAVKREKLCAYSRSYGKQNRSAIRAKQRARVAANPEKYRTRLKRYRQANPQLSKIHWQRRMARLRGAAGSYSSLDVYQKLKVQGGLCYYCKAPLETFEIEHKIPISQGGSNWPANICCACKDCNRQKHARSFWDFANEKGMFRAVRLGQAK